MCEQMTALTRSTLFHLLAIYYAHNAYYVAIITASTLASYLWHKVGRGFDTLGKIDYTLAGVWGTYDCVYSYMYCPAEVWGDICMLNLLICLLNYLVVWLDRKSIVPYEFGHTLWHYMSAYKAVYVARAIIVHQVPQMPPLGTS
jgi:hypothetical protein